MKKATNNAVLLYKLTKTKQEFNFFSQLTIEKCTTKIAIKTAFFQKRQLLRYKQSEKKKDKTNHSVMFIYIYV